ncbi:MAG: hypothetical protein DRO05_04470 [Thermoproteota archaeon]|nr:MAG: hypothetical protein DRO05_04470 [Candidatus Korarchaeota archaeon]
MTSSKRSGHLVVFILISIVLGAIAGYVAGYSMQMKKISGLKDQLAKVQQDLAALKDSFSDLNQSYYNLARLASEVHEASLSATTEWVDAYYALSASMYEERTERQIDLLEDALDRIDASISAFEELIEKYQELSEKSPVHKDTYEKYERIVQAELKFLQGEKKVINATLIMFKVIHEIEESEELLTEKWLSMLEDSKGLYEEALDLLEDASRTAPEVRMKYEAEKLHINYLLDILYEFEEILTET